MGGQSNFYVHNIGGLFYLLRLFTRVGWVVKKGQNSVYVVIALLCKFFMQVIVVLLLGKHECSYLKNQASKNRTL